MRYVITFFLILFFSFFAQASAFPEVNRLVQKTSFDVFRNYINYNQFENKTTSFVSLSEILSNNSLKSEQGQDFYIFSTNSILIKSKQSALAPFKIFIMSGLHGDELAGPDFSFWLIKRLNESSGLLSKLIEKSNRDIVFDFLPMANPDGILLKSRTNAKAVDLNRNFPVTWKPEGYQTQNADIFLKADLAKETEAIKELLTASKYDMAFDVHGYADKIYSPSPSKAFSAGAEYSKTFIAKKTMLNGFQNTLAKEMKLFPNYQLTNSFEASHRGSFEDFAFWEKNVLSACLEISSEQKMMNGEELEVLYIRYEHFLSQVIKMTILNAEAKANTSVTAK